jgi:transcriptional regulator with XRE-family HTH domain
MSAATHGRLGGRVRAYRFSGERAREARVAAGKSEEEAGAEVDRSASAIKLYEYEYRTPPIDVLIALAAAYDVPVESFFVVEVPA